MSHYLHAISFQLLFQMLMLLVFHRFLFLFLKHSHAISLFAFLYCVWLCTLGTGETLFADTALLFCWKRRIPTAKESAAVVGVLPEYLQLMRSAWAHTPQARPTFVAVAAQLIKLRTIGSNIHVNPNQAYSDQLDSSSNSSNSSNSTTIRQKGDSVNGNVETHALIDSLRTSLLNPTYEFADSGTLPATKSHYE